MLERGGQRPDLKDACLCLGGEGEGAVRSEGDGGSGFVRCKWKE